MRLLVIEDNKELALSIKAGLEKNGFILMFLTPAWREKKKPTRMAMILFYLT